MSAVLTPSQIAALINQQIIPNGVGAITGQILNNALQQIVSLLAMGLTQGESVQVTGVNTLGPLQNLPSGPFVFLTVNGQLFFNGAPTPAFTVVGKALTWNASNAGFSLATTDVVTALYSY